MNLNYIFNVKPGDEFKGANIAPIARAADSTNAFASFKAHQKGIREKYQSKKYHLLRSTLATIMPDFKWSCIYRFLEQSTSVIFPLVFKYYTKYLQREEISLIKVSILILIVSLINFGRNMAAQHSLRLQSKTLCF